MKGCPKCGKRFEKEILYCPDDGDPLSELTATTPDPLIGKTLDQRYVIEKQAGRGRDGDCLSRHPRRDSEGVRCQGVAKRSPDKPKPQKKPKKKRPKRRVSGDIMDPWN
jgi:hypothetical protein